MTVNLHPHHEPLPEPEIEDVEFDAGHYHAEDYGTTRREARRVEPLDLRLSHEEPDVDAEEPRDAPGATRDALSRSAHVDEPSHWNLLVTVRPGRADAAERLLKRVGVMQPSPFPEDVLLTRVGDVFDALDVLSAAMVDDPVAGAAIARVRPGQHTFACANRAELERVTEQFVGDWLDDLANTAFHVRCHHRGSDDIDGADEEAFLGEVVLGELARNGASGRVDLRDPDVIIDIETVDGQGEASLWTRADLRAYPFLRLR